MTVLIANLSQALSQPTPQYLAQVQQALAAPWPGGKGLLPDAPELRECFRPH